MPHCSSLALSPSPESKIQRLNNYEYKKEKNLGLKKRNFIKKKKNLHVDLHLSPKGVIYSQRDVREGTRTGSYLQRARSARTIAAIASTTTGARSAKQASCLPWTSRMSIWPVAKLNVC